MGVDRIGLSDEDKLPCCGHSWRLHTPACRYWYPGTKLDAPQECGCDGAVTPKRATDAAETAHPNAASAPAR